jgi:DNA-binding MarR family transcriptional regulator
MVLIVQVYDWRNNLENFIDCIIVIKNEWDKFLKNSLSKYSITYGEYNGIVVLDYKEKLSSNILAGRMNLSPSRASRVIENMVKKKVLIRDIDCDDRRKCTIELTKRGLEIKNMIEKIKFHFYNKIVGDLKQDELIAVKFALKKIIDSCQKEKHNV